MHARTHSRTKEGTYTEVRAEEHVHTHVRADKDTCTHVRAEEHVQKRARAHIRVIRTRAQTACADQPECTHTCARSILK